VAATRIQSEQHDRDREQDCDSYAYDHPAIMDQILHHFSWIEISLSPYDVAARRHFPTLTHFFMVQGAIFERQGRAIACSPSGSQMVRF
jgi:hypothetical protein